MKSCGPIAFKLTAATLALCCATSLPVASAFAKEFPDNYDNTVLIGSNDSMGTNYGYVDTNEGVIDNNVGTVETNSNGGTVETNNGTVETNSGTVEVNNGTIVNNYSFVPNNNGVITNNFSVNVGYEAVGPDAHIVNNYLGGYGSENSSVSKYWGEENFYRIKDRLYNIEGLDWSMNSDLLSPDGSPYIYVGSQSNSKGLRNAVFKAKEGYSIIYKDGQSDNCRVVLNEDGNYTVSVLDSSCMELDISPFVDIVRLCKIAITSSPEAGGTFTMNGEEFESGYCDLRDRVEIKAVANEGYKFVSWDGNMADFPQDTFFVDGDTVYIHGYWDNRFDDILLHAVFEKIQSAVDDGLSGDESVNGGGSDGAEDPSGESVPDSDNATASDSDITYGQLPSQLVASHAQNNVAVEADPLAATGDGAASSASAFAAALAGFVALFALHRRDISRR